MLASYAFHSAGFGLQLFTAAPKAVALTLLVLDLLLMPLLLAAATGLFVLLPGAPGCAVEAVLVLLRTSAAFASDDFEDPNHPPINAKGVVFRALSFLKRM